MKKAKSLNYWAAPLVGVLAFGTASFASAAHVTSFDYTVTTGFVASSPAGVEEINSVNIPTPTGTVEGFDTLRWGTGTTFSSLTVESNLSGNIETGEPAGTFGPAEAGATITHDNRPIALNSPFLTNATLLSSLVLTPSMPNGSELAPIPAEFSISFKETINDGSCVTGSLSNCDDIFVLENPSDLQTSFTLDGFIYTIKITPLGLVPLASDACTEAGAAAGCLGFLTQENGSNPLNTEFSISYQPVPIPAAAWLLGSGLIGLVGIGRIRGQKAKQS